jgi:hypothetical protein
LLNSRHSSTTLSPERASSFARLALENIEREFPAKLDHVISGTLDIVSPRELHPAFFGSFDWHSCVHAHWLLACVLRLHPGLPEAGAIRAALAAHLAPQNIVGEIDYLRRPQSRSFERTYGWAWLLKLAADLACWDDPDGRRWSRGLAPLAQVFVDRFQAYLPSVAYPIRHGTHPNSAFALAFALDFARACDANALEELCTTKARDWYLSDRDAPAAWEPSGADFLSPALIEADLMRRVLGRDAFTAWLSRFLPAISQRAPAALFVPVTVSDRSDPLIVHLDGLNLSRAWCWRAIAAALPEGDPRVQAATEAAGAHLRAGMEGCDSGEYVGEHWLATFAVLALTT